MRYLFLSTKIGRVHSNWAFLFDTEVLATKLDTIISTITVLHVLAFYIRQNKEKDNYNGLHEDLLSYPIPAGDHMT